tara:strand:- start:166 stop:750 length:585 start_codon:yes stop_codon:yes gene_type:complete
MRYATFILTIALAGCTSAKKSIGSAAHQINAMSANSFESAQVIQQRAETSLTRPSVQSDESVVESQMVIIDLAGQIMSDQAQIAASSVGIQNDLHFVEDLTPWWASMLGNLAIAAIIIGVIILLWQTGIGMIIKKAMWSLGLFIPKATMRSAAADIKALDGGHEMSPREAVAIRRTSDPAYEAARKKLKKEKSQ